MPVPDLPLVLVTHPRNRLDTYFGDEALARLRRVAQVRFNTEDEDLSGAALVESARGCAVVIAYHMMDGAAFAAMRRGSFFINAARGDLVDDAALLLALDSGRLAGAALDVGRAADQMPSPALACHPGVIATPHIGGLTAPAIEHQALETVAQTQLILQGRIPAGAVNAQAAARMRSQLPA